MLCATVSDPSSFITGLDVFPTLSKATAPAVGTCESCLSLGIRFLFIDSVLLASPFAYLLITYFVGL